MFVLLLKSKKYIAAPQAILDNLASKYNVCMLDQFRYYLSLTEAHQQAKSLSSQKLVIWPVHNSSKIWLTESILYSVLSQPPEKSEI